jgi:protein-L-isoaspartate(D-aspartate) O-methyltransferase
LYDSIKQKGKRKRLVEKLASKGIKDKRVLEAIINIPRHFFMDKDFQDYAYDDKAFPITNNQTISQPYTVAFQTQSLNIIPNDKVLEIGTGSGYQTSILIYMKSKVYTVEIKWSDGYQGLSENAPFDKILVTAGCPDIPSELLKQLSINGKMIIPVGLKEQEMFLVKKEGDNNYSKKNLGKFNFVPMLKNKI